MRNFESLGWYEVRGKPAASVKLDRDTPRENLFASLSTDGISIDGVPYTLTGVESFAIPTIRAGTTIGLVVEPRDSLEWTGETTVDENGIWRVTLPGTGWS